MISQIFSLACISKLINSYMHLLTRTFGSDNGLSPIWHLAIVWTNAWLSIKFEWKYNSFGSEMLSSKWLLFCLQCNVLIKPESYFIGVMSWYIYASNLKLKDTLGSIIKKLTVQSPETCHGYYVSAIM